MYFIITKQELIDGEMTHKSVGYTTSVSDSESLNTDYDNSLGSWINSNLIGLESGKTLVSEFFETTPYVYHAKQQTTSIDGIGLTEITDLNSL